MREGTLHLPALGDREFAAYQSLIYRESGIHLSAAKKALLVARLSRRLRELGLSRFREHLQRIESDAGELRRTLEAICTHETSFFREPRHFEHLEREALPAIRARAGLRGRQVRAWSAGCSSGEEPFSLAMTLARALPAVEGWSVQVLATDLSTQVLERARAAEWPLEGARAIPEPLLKSFMLRGAGPREGRMRAAASLRAMVRFEQLNLNDPAWRVEGRFDLIFCRNVLIYFDASSKARVVSRLIDRLQPDGLLFVGHAEALGSVTDALRCVSPTIYARR